MPSCAASIWLWYSCRCASVTAVARAACAVARFFCAVASWPAIDFLNSATFFVACARAAAGEIWMLFRYATRSLTACSFFGPPPATPQAGIGVPGRPYVMIWVTCCSARVVQLSDFVARSSPVHSLNRYITSLSDGATHVSFTGFALGLPWASGVSTNVAAPPLASAPWQFAHWSDLALS